MQAQIVEEERSEKLLQGYRPHKEIMQWTLLAILVTMPLIFVTIADLPFFSDISMMANMWRMGWWGAGLILVFPLLFMIMIVFFGIMKPRFFIRKFRRNERIAKFLLYGNASIDQPVLETAPAEGDLTFSLQAKARKSALGVRILLWGALFLYLLFMTLNIVFRFEFISSYLFSLVAASSVIVLTVPIGGAIVLNGITSDFFFHPSLTVTPETITATYGKQSIVMNWQDMRLFVITKDYARNPQNQQFTDKQIKRINDRKDEWALAQRAILLTFHERELYELSDGQNTICWYAQQRKNDFFVYRRPEGELVSGNDYSTLMQTLAATIVAKSGCRLYDLREPQTRLDLEKASQYLAGR